MDYPYLQEFGLSRDPFSVAPDPSFLYLSAGHREALAQLEYGVRARRGFILLTGEVGTGKTTLIHALLEGLEGSTQAAFVYHTVVSPKDLLRYVCEDFGVLPSQQDDHRELHDYLILLNRFLLESYRRGENVVLVVDESQNLTPEVLESVRLLSNFETSRDKLLQILLVGQPELRVKLDLPELRQLKQRVAIRAHLEPLDYADCKQYVAKRLEVVGGSPQLFTPKALETVYLGSGGIPRLINILCDNAMLRTCASGKKKIDAPVVREVAEKLKFPIPPEGQETINGKRSLNGRKITAATEPSAAEEDETAAGIPLQTGLSEPPLAKAPSDILSPGFFETIVAALAEAMGPMASLAVRDHISQLGESYEAFPKARLQDLVDRISREILHESLKVPFQQAVALEVRRLETPRASGSGGRDNGSSTSFSDQSKTRSL